MLFILSKPDFIYDYGIFLGIVLVSGLILSLFPQKKCQPSNSPDGRNGKPLFPGGFSSPVIALELAASGAAIGQILAGAGCRIFQRKGVIADIFIIIPLYWLLVSAQCLLCFFAGEGGDGLLSTVGWAAFICVTLAAVFDYIEDYFMWRAIKHTGEPTDLMARNIRYPSLCKWSFLFISFVLLSDFFFSLGGWGLLIGGCYSLSFLIGIFGVIFFRPIISKAFYPLGLAILPLIYLCLWRASELAHLIN